METTDLIEVHVVCKHYKIPETFINTLKEFELIELTVLKNEFFIHRTELQKVEKIARLHYDLEINMEGIDAIYNLLEQVNTLKKEITNLNNRLRLYEDL
ncbi:chaperone modulator CbpM [Aestuariibaculum suncheonense]|uniref:Chaperone modulator CbpM n=1 Tax=Aestuariibaculum suncheonense TaxID=1028745 RepID=A0A8J6UBM3_9FLAO|nr:chaperone modulator CbpM [Aestuariibaculum suncheonense]MBD0835592.1 chaperone modulator CbpM [Aestuariibaculum suncheonense]